MAIKQTVNKHKSLLESFFSLSILNGLSVLFPLLTMPYILRVVGPEKYGVYGFIYILVQYVLIFNSYGFDFSATKEITQNRDNKEYINRIFSSVLVCRFLLLLVTCAVFMALSPLLMPLPVQKIMFLSGLVLVLGNTFIPVWLFQGMEKMRYLTVVNVIGKSLFFVLVFVVIRRPEDYIWLPLVDGTGYVAAGILSMIIARKQFRVKFRFPSWVDIKTQFRNGAAVFGSTLGMTLYRKSNIFILNFFVGEAALGIYTAAEKIVTGLQSIISPVSQALFPHLGHSFAMHSRGENIKTLRKVSVYMFLLLAAATAGMVVFADFLIKILCGAEFMQARTLLVIMSPVMLFGGMNYVLGIVGLINLDKSKNFLLGVVSAGICSVTWVLSTAPVLGVTAGAWAMTIAETVLFINCFVSLIVIKNKTEK